MKRQWLRSPISLLLVAAAMFAASGAPSRMQAARENQPVAPSHSDASAETTFTVSVMRSFEVDLPDARSDAVVVRTNGDGGYTRRLTEVHRFQSPPGSRREPASETLVYIYVITPNY